MAVEVVILVRASKPAARQLLTAVSLGFATWRSVAVVVVKHQVDWSEPSTDIIV